VNGATNPALTRKAAFAGNGTAGGAGIVESTATADGALGASADETDFCDWHPTKGITAHKTAAVRSRIETDLGISENHYWEKPPDRQSVKCRIVLLYSQSLKRRRLQGKH
jgi:hypothetical protein